MSLLTVNGMLATNFGRFININQNADVTLKFNVIGSYFPARNGLTRQSVFGITGQVGVENKVYIDFNDGTGEHTYNLKASGTNRQIRWGANPNITTPVGLSVTGVYNDPVYYFQDLPEGVKNTVNDTYGAPRTITVRFENPQGITGIDTGYLRFYDQLPASLSRMRNLDTLIIRVCEYITSFPQDFYNSRIKTLLLDTIGSVMNSGFPNWILNSPIESLTLDSTVNLAGSAEDKRFDEINKLKDTIKILSLESTGINYTMPQQLNELYKLETLVLRGNNSPLMRFPDDISGLTALKLISIDGARMPFSEIVRLMGIATTNMALRFIGAGYTTDQDITGTNTTVTDLYIGGQTWNAGQVPSFVSKLSNLKILRLANVSTAQQYAGLTGYGNFSACTNLEQIAIYRLSALTTDVPAWFSSLTKLKQLPCYGSFSTTARMNAFVDSLYAFVVANAAMVGTAANPFRSMTIDAYGSNSIDRDNSTRPSGTYQQPSGYVQGSNNGSPASAMEKIWVLTNQYGHVWSVKPL